MAIERVTRNRHPFDQQMRIALHQDAILERSRLAFVGIAQQVCRFTGGAWNKTPLHPSRKPRAAAAPQSAGLHLFDDRGLLHRQRLLKRLIPAALAILLDAGLFRLFYVSEENLSHRPGYAGIRPADLRYYSFRRFSMILAIRAGVRFS